MFISSDAAERVTAADFLAHSAARGPSELVRGVVRVMSPAGGAHGVVVGNVFAALNAFVREHQLGQCFADNTGFELAGLADTVRSPDTAFVARANLPIDGVGPGWVRATPDLVVEVLSPFETSAELNDKLGDYRVAGTRVVWVVDPASRTVTVRSSRAVAPTLTESDMLDGGDVLPGFVLPVSALFDGIAR